MDKDSNKSDDGIQYFEQIIKAPQKGVRYNCPCCGYPTLEERGGYEICELCGWEDDGQDDPHADEVWGGPNGSLSLTAARENFNTILDKYDPKEYTSRFEDTDLELEKHHKRALMEAFAAVRREPDLKKKAKLWKKVFEYEKLLDEDLTNSVHAFEKRIAEKRGCGEEAGIMTNLELLTYTNIIEKFLGAFPESLEPAESHREMWDGNGEQLVYVFFSYVINEPLMGILEHEKTSPYLIRLFAFFENMANSSDEMVPELLGASTLERLGDDKNILLRARALMGPKTLVLSHDIERGWGRE